MKGNFNKRAKESDLARQQSKRIEARSQRQACRFGGYGALQVTRLSLNRGVVGLKMGIDDSAGACPSVHGAAPCRVVRPILLEPVAAQGWRRR
jgi:hypothetical protein